MSDQLPAYIAAVILDEIRVTIVLTTIIVLSALISVAFWKKSYNIRLIYGAVALLGIYAVNQEETAIMSAHSATAQPGQVAPVKR